jgi:hypothetical protein
MNFKLKTNAIAPIKAASFLSFFSKKNKKIQRKAG